MSSIVRKPFFLPAGDILRIEDGPGTWIRPENGCLWVTQEGDPRDHILGAGQSMLLEKGRLTLVEALEATQLELLMPIPEKRSGAPMRLELLATRQPA